MTLQPTDTRHTAPQGVFRSTCTTLCIVAVFLATLVTSIPASAQGRGARLSSDLRERLAAPDTGSVDVILNGSPERVTEIARVTGSRSRRR